MSVGVLPLKHVPVFLFYLQAKTAVSLGVFVVKNGEPQRHQGTKIYKETQVSPETIAGDTYHSQVRRIAPPHSEDYKQAILATLLACLPPSKSDEKNVSTIFSASENSMNLAGRHSTLASLCCLARAASSSFQHTAALMP